MSVTSAIDAKNRFGRMLEMAQKEPVRIQKNGRDVGIDSTASHEAIEFFVLAISKPAHSSRTRSIPDSGRVHAP